MENAEIDAMAVLVWANIAEAGALAKVHAKGIATEVVVSRRIQVAIVRLMKRFCTRQFQSIALTYYALQGYMRVLTAGLLSNGTKKC